MDRHTAEDVIEAAERAGGAARLHGPWATGNYGVGILRLPDVGRFLRALAACGVSGTVTYSAGSGWSVDTKSRAEGS